MAKEKWEVIAYFLTAEILDHRGHWVVTAAFLCRYKVNLTSAKSQEKVTEVRTRYFIPAIHPYVCE